MSLLSLTVGVSGIALSLMSLFISKEVSSYRQDGATFKMQRTLVYFLVIVALCAILFSAFIFFRRPQYDGQAGDALVPMVIAGICVICALVWTYYEVRLEDDGLHLGLQGRKILQYSQVVKIVDIRNQGSPRAVLITESGDRVGIWSNLLGYERLISELQIRCGCDYVKLEARGQKE